MPLLPLPTELRLPGRAAPGQPGGRSCVHASQQPTPAGPEQGLAADAEKLRAKEAQQPLPQGLAARAQGGGTAVQAGGSIP
eukprot:1139421-Pelagomonas_calceolata.AAC.5